MIELKGYSIMVKVQKLEINVRTLGSFWVIQATCCLFPSWSPTDMCKFNVTFYLSKGKTISFCNFSCLMFEALLNSASHLILQIFFHICKIPSMKWLIESHRLSYVDHLVLNRNIHMIVFFVLWLTYRDKII